MISYSFPWSNRVKRTLARTSTAAWRLGLQDCQWNKSLCKYSTSGLQKVMNKRLVPFFLKTFLLLTFLLCQELSLPSACSFLLMSLTWKQCQPKAQPLHISYFSTMALDSAIYLPWWSDLVSSLYLQYVFVGLILPRGLLVTAPWGWSEPNWGPGSDNSGYDGDNPLERWLQ